MTRPRASVAFLVANDRHHTAAALPVIEHLRHDGVPSRVLSMAEFRGLESPSRQLRELGVPMDSLIPFRFRSPSIGSNPGPGGGGSRRNLLRSLLWHMLLGPSVKGSLEPRPGLVVLPNDGAYPYDRISNLLTRLAIPYLVLQEGIRFTASPGSREGRSGAAAWAVWGETSAAYFRAQGTPPADIHITGSPRFDELLARDWSREAVELRDRLSGGRPFLTLLSNPIDDLGFVSTSEKIELIRKLAEGAAPMVTQNGWHLVIKLHQRESASDVKAALSPLAAAPISVVSDCPLYPLLFAARGALTFASSVGLEALLCRAPLGVVEIPGHGFLHDFVASGAARGISWDHSVPEQLQTWLDESQSRQSAVSSYLEESVAHRGEAAAHVAGLIRQLLDRYSEGPS